MTTLDVNLVLKLPHPHQRQVLDQAARFNTLACGRRWGKTELGIEHLAIPTFLAGQPVGWFAPTYKLLDEAWQSMLDALAPMRDVLEVSKVDRRIRGPNGGTIDYWTLAGTTKDASQAGRGRKYKRVIVDEAAHARYLQHDWTKAIRPTLADLEGDAWFLSTPRGRNYFHTLWARDGNKGWKSWRLPTSTNPFIKATEIEEAHTSLPADAFQQEYLAEFLANAANPFGLEHIHACVQPVPLATPSVWGVDLAKSQDWTVACGLSPEGSVVACERWQGDWLSTQDRLTRLIGHTAAVVDSTGVGDPVCEALEDRCPQIERYPFTSKSKQQLMEGLAVAIQQRQVRYPPGVIVDELESFEYVYRPGHVYYSAPPGMHDDCVCALALAVHGLNAGRFAPRMAVEMIAGEPDDDDDDSF